MKPKSMFGRKRQPISVKTPEEMAAEREAKAPKPIPRAESDATDASLLLAATAMMGRGFLGGR